MKYKTFIKIKVVTGGLIGLIVGIAVSIDNLYLALAGVLAGVIFMMLAKSRLDKNQILVDERLLLISGNAARATYMLITIIAAITGLSLMLLGKSQQNPTFEAIGTTLNSIALLSIISYSIFYHYFNQKHG